MARRWTEYEEAIVRGWFGKVPTRKIALLIGRTGCAVEKKFYTLARTKSTARSVRPPRHGRRHNSPEMDPGREARIERMRERFERGEPIHQTEDHGYVDLN